MQTYVRHRLELHLCVTQYDDGLRADVGRQVIAGCLERARAADALPFALEDRALFLREEFMRCIDTGRHRMRIVERTFATRAQVVDQRLHCTRPCRVGHGVPLNHRGESALKRGFAVTHSTWTSIYQANLQAKILF